MNTFTRMMHTKRGKAYALDVALGFWGKRVVTTSEHRRAVRDVWDIGTPATVAGLLKWAADYRRGGLVGHARKYVNMARQYRLEGRQ